MVVVVVCVCVWIFDAEDLFKGRKFPDVDKMCDGNLLTGRQLLKMTSGVRS